MSHGNVHWIVSRPKGLTLDPLDIDCLIEWLEPSKDYMETHLSIREKRIHADTGQWVFENSKFEKWRDRPGSQLWLYGKGALLIPTIPTRY